MDPQSFSLLFAAFVLATLAVKLWLASRHIRHVSLHRNAVPEQFAAKIPLAAHQKAADYTVAKTRLKIVLLVVNAVALIGFTLLGGLQWLSVTLSTTFGVGMTYQLALVAAVMIISSVIDLPLDYYKQFRLEERFGFNKMTRSLFFSDLVKHSIVGAAIGLPLLWVTLALMEQAGSL
jgi:STE24 endopeptidase